MKSSQEFFRGCLIGGAIGDALGWPVEFKKYTEIIKQYGPKGISDLQLASTGKAEITDDTQMTLFTAEGILRAQTRFNEKGICNAPDVVFYAYQRWLYTQGHSKVMDWEWCYDGWLLSIKELFHRRSPGTSCLSALISKKHGSITEPVNNSKGCGGVMRVAPAGLFFGKDDAFDMAIDFAALTHGHPSGYLSAGAFSYMIACIIEGQFLNDAVDNTIAKLKIYKDHQECITILKLAKSLVISDISDIKAITRLGAGWTGEEALGIATYCALKYKDDFEKAIITAINHDGDSDSTGAITGNILGAYLGFENIPERWIEDIELKDVLIQISDDLLVGYQEGDLWWNRYPGY